MIKIFMFLDKKNPLFKYSIGKEVEYARLGANKVIINTYTESISIQFSKDNGKFVCSHYPHVNQSEFKLVNI